MQRILQRPLALAGAILLGLVFEVAAHGHDEDTNMNMVEPSIARPTIALASQTPEAGPQSYFQHGEHSGWIVSHILLMTTAWVFILPVGMLFSISRSRYRFAVQFLFLATNAIGVLLATIYNASTPDLYPNNAHHKLGWVLTWVVCAHAVMGIISVLSGGDENEQHEEHAAFIPVSNEAMAEHHRLQSSRIGETYRFSTDSGQGTEPNTESLRSQSVSSNGSHNILPESPQDVEDYETEKISPLSSNRLVRFLSRRLPGLLSSRALRVFDFLYNFIDRVILLLAFAGIATGIATYGGFFMASTFFSGLAHVVKGGVFFWFGIMTLGRWAGCFAEIGWAWNINPSRKNRPSAEFVESFLIFLYGSTNVFLEHLEAWGSNWSAQDLEHLSITFLFIGGGLCGMLIESKRIRKLLNASLQPPRSHLQVQAVESEQQEPESYKFSMNPLPALVTLLVGMMMSSHHQDSMVSTMIHKQWGTLLVAAAFARAATYIIYYITPPTSVLPGRPPTEIITAFCLMAGGFIFMVSSRDTVAAMENNDLDAMFIFTVTMGLITFLMAWIIVVIALKGWAVRKENRSRLTYRSMGVA